MLVNLNPDILIFQDDEIPIKGHGLIVLTKLVQQKEVVTEKNIETVIRIFQVFLTCTAAGAVLQWGLGEPNMFGFWMVQGRSIGEWFGIPTPFENGTISLVF